MQPHTCGHVGHVLPGWEHGCVGSKETVQKEVVSAVSFNECHPVACASSTVAQQAPETCSPEGKRCGYGGPAVPLS